MIAALSILIFWVSLASTKLGRVLILAASHFMGIAVMIILASASMIWSILIITNKLGG